MKKPKTVVTDHALVRYLEVVVAADMEGLRRRIGRACDLALEHDAEKVKVNGVTFVVKDGHCVTVEESTNRRRRRLKAQ